MLCKNHEVEIWKTEWVGRRIHNVYYSLNIHSFRSKKDEVKKHKYIALVCEINPSRSFGIYGGSAPLIALDLAKLAIDLTESNRRRIEAKKSKSGNETKNA